MQEEIVGKKPKYKEILAAMLTMVSIGVSFSYIMYQIYVTDIA